MSDLWDYMAHTVACVKTLASQTFPWFRWVGGVSSIGVEDWGQGAAECEPEPACRRWACEKEGSTKVEGLHVLHSP